MRNILQNVFLNVLAIALCSNLLAQGVTTSGMSGLVTDTKGDPLPGATVVAVHVPSGTQYGTATQVDGRYSIPNMRVGGPYKVSITYIGFKESVKENISLLLGVFASIDFKLSEEAAALQEIVVTSERDNIFSSDRTGASTNISNEQITRLPTLNRSFSDFTRLTPQAGGPFNSIGGRNGGFNNITIDGALFNNAFGLSSTIGGQANAQPVSLDAIDQIQVSIAPYDVRQGSFTGAAINAVTRSGDNEIRGSVFYFNRNQDFVGKKVEDFEQKIADFKLNNVGFRLGGPIIKNKLFFFVNGEFELRDDPPTPFFVAARPPDLLPATGNNVSAVTAAELDQLRDFLRNTYGYDPGEYENYQLKSNSYKATVKIDWNINNNHRFNIKYNYLKSFRDVPPSTSGALPNGRGPTNTNLPFSGAYYRINNNLNSVIAELNSTLSNKFSNTFTAGFTAMRDFRESTSGIFPGVDIGNGASSPQSSTSFGYEPFSANNILNTDIFQISDNFTIYAGKHTLTLGTYNEFYKFQNGFAPNFYGGYQFNSFADFYASATNGTFNARQYLLRYSALPDGSFPLVETKASQLGFYVQDEYYPIKNLKLTAGLRLDIPIINSDILQNDQAAGFSFRDGDVINTSQLQKSSLLWSPRIGFNWDIFGDKKTQVRGGTGIFTGRVPYVWISNQASNNGLLFGSVFLNAAQVVSNRIAFNPDVNAYRAQFAGAGANATYNLAVTAENFKFPQVWRSNIAVDQSLPWGIVATAEFAYTKDINAVYHVNANLPDAQTNAVGADNRPRFTSNRINANITDAIIMKNTDQGFSYFITGQLQKQFDNGFYASVAYTYSESKSINDGGSIAQSIWRDRVISGDPNAIALSFSNFMVRHRVVGSVSYRKEYLNNFATSISLFYSAAPSDRFSYTYSGDMNGDGSGGGGNDLIYIPRDQSEIRLVDIVFSAAQGGGSYTADQQWSDLDAYISQDKYLSSRRGQYAERNGAEAPFLSQLDFRILQDFFVNVKGKRNTIQLSLDIFNIGNMLNANWGIRQTTNRAALISFNNYSTGGNYLINGVQTAVPTGTPTFTYPFLSGQANNNPVSLNSTFRNDTGPISRWQMQFGVRYIFN